MSVGDTIHSAVTNLTDTNIVQSIDSIFIGSDYRKIYYYNSIYMPDTCTHFLIEGIGSGAGLFSELCGSCFEHGYRLECFKQNDITLYYPNNMICQVDTGTVCNFTVSLPEQKSENYFSLIPNPATNEIKIENAKSKIESVEVFDVMGQLQTSNFKPQTISVEVSSLAQGIYFVRVRTEKGSITRKLIKQ
jgi:hypothetical protein